MTAGLSGDPRVLGLVALGSMARADYLPDQWSDHDFFVIVQTGTQEAFRSNLAWLPQAAEIVFSFRETAHGLKVLYRNAHLLEFAIFDPEELFLARVNRSLVLFDRQRVQENIDAVQQQTAKRGEQEKPSFEFSFGQFLTNLVVGVGRYRRGEKLSGTAFVKTHALRHLLLLLSEALSSSERTLLDNLDPFRRFERVFPALGEELNLSLDMLTPLTARKFIEIIRKSCHKNFNPYFENALNAVQEFLDREK